MNSATSAPLRIHIRREAGDMEIEWKDVGVRRIGLRDLRRRCPCAVCEGLREQQRKQAGLHMITDAEAAATAEVLDAIPVGRYAIQIRWGDGHDTGIYPYDYLRRLSSELGDHEEAT